MIKQKSRFIRQLQKRGAYRLTKEQQDRAWRFYQQSGGYWPLYVNKPPGPSIELGRAYRSNENYLIINQTSLVEDITTGQPLAYFLKGIIKDPRLIQAGRHLDTYAQKSNQRRMAAGRGTRYQYGQIANPVYSSIVGYADKSNFHPCRMTALYKRHERFFNQDTLPLLRYISKQFAYWCPQHYKRQMDFVKSINPHMVLTDTCYTTITVNLDFRTHAHRDTGDYHSGLGNLTVFQKEGTQKFSGGEFLLPEYQIGFNMQEGDLLFVDVHQIHCNNPIRGKGRISLVCYAREGILRKCEGVSRQQLRNWRSYRRQK